MRAANLKLLKGCSHQCPPCLSPVMWASMASLYPLKQEIMKLTSRMTPLVYLFYPSLGIQGLIIFFHYCVFFQSMFGPELKPGCFPYCWLPYLFQGGYPLPGWSVWALVAIHTPWILGRVSTRTGDWKYRNQICQTTFLSDDNLMTIKNQESVFCCRRTMAGCMESGVCAAFVWFGDLCVYTVGVSFWTCFDIFPFEKTTPNLTVDKTHFNNTFERAMHIILYRFGSLLVLLGINRTVLSADAISTIGTVSTWARIGN